MVFSLIALLFLPASLAVSLTGPSKDIPLLIQTRAGPVQGFLDNTTTPNTPLRKWYGVRFAQDTSGANRWRPPKPALSHKNEIFNATAFGPACMQGRPPATAGAGTSVQSEDCLRINVVAPAGAKGLPVYLYSYGGGFDSGSPSDPKIDGSFLAARGIVFASYGYRLSLFGYPHAAEIAAAGETQNFGLLDTRAAVEWLQDNIAAFGGDPNKITLGGESVGAEMTNQYMSAFSKDPIIRAAVMQSADTNQPMWQLNDQISFISRNFSCPTGPGQLDCLRKVSGVDLQTVLLATGKQFQPVTDNITVFKDYIKQTRQRTVASIPLLIGTNKDEGTLIVQGEPTATDEIAYVTSNNLNIPWASPSALAKVYPVPSAEFPAALNATAGMWRDAHMLCLASNLGRERTNVLRQPVWRYRFDLLASNLNSQGTSIGVFHGEDIRFVMGTTSLINNVTAFQQKVSDLMVTAWTNFIKDPHVGPAIPGWKQYNPSDTTTLAILGLSEDKADPGNHLETDKSCAFWNTVLPIFPQTFPLCGSWTCSS